MSLAQLDEVIVKAKGMERWFQPTAPDSEADALRATLVKLKTETDELRSRYAPSLRRRITVKRLLSRPDRFISRSIAVAGWIRTSREGGKGKFIFVKVYDGTTADELQVLVKADVPGFAAIAAAGVGASVLLTGVIVPSPAAGQAVEMEATEAQVLGNCDPREYPLAGKRLPLDFLRQQGHMRYRSMVMGAVQRVRNALSFATHQYFQNAGFQYVHAPLITGSDCEGAGEMFQVTTLLEGKQLPLLPNGKVDFSKDFFKKPTFLTVSGQLNAEVYAMALSSVYTFGPTFRAELSNTYRHLAEFWMIEPEIAFADLEENQNVAEAFIKYVIRACLERQAADMKLLEDFEARMEVKRKEDLEKEQEAQKKAGKEVKVGRVAEQEWRAVPLRKRMQAIVEAQFARVTYTEAIALLAAAEEKGHNFEAPAKVAWGMDLASSHERWLCEVHFGRPTIVTNYPKEIKSFYMRLNEDGKTVAAMDVLVPGIGELIGGSQREERLDHLLARLKDDGLDEASYSWYLDLRRFGTVPHSGFGAGFERLVCYATGMNNIRDAIPFPRYPGHADF